MGQMRAQGAFSHWRQEMGDFTEPLLTTWDAGDEFVALFQGLFKGQAVVGGDTGDFAAAARLALFRDRFDHVTAHGIFLTNFRSQSGLSAGVDAGDEEVPAALAFQPQAFRIPGSGSAARSWEIRARTQGSALRRGRS